MVLALLALLSSLSFAQQDAKNIGCFLGMNDTDGSVVLSDCEAQDALNVESNLSGTAIIKRKGFSREASLTVTTAPITGAFEWTCDSGDKNIVVCHDRYCSKSTNDSAFTNFLSTAGGTGAVPTRWSFVTVDGDLYGANDRRDAVLKYDCTNLTHPSEIPAGSLLDLSDARLIVSDTAANPNRVNYSKSADYTEFTVGSESVDPWTDDIGAPGDRITALKSCNDEYIFKRQSLTTCLLDDQYTTHCSVISDVIGTQDPNSVVCTPYGLHWKAQDGSYWRLANDGMELLSRKISGYVRNQASGASRSNTQTTQTDWQDGTDTPNSSWNTASAAGSIFPSSGTLAQTTTAAFVLGSMNAGAVTVSSYSLLSGVLMANASFESGNITNWTDSGSGTFDIKTSSLCGTATTGTFSWGSAYILSSPICSGGTPSVVVEVIDAGTSDVLYRKSHSSAVNLACDHKTIDLSTQTVQVKIRILTAIGGANITSDQAISTSAFPNGILDYGVGARAPAQAGGGTCANGPRNEMILDFPHPYYAGTSTFTSSALDTTFSTPTWSTISLSTSLVAGSTLAYTVQAATSSSGEWETAVSVTNGGKNNAAQKQYLRYTINFRTNRSTTTASVFSASLPNATTGQFVTQCIQPGTNITSWGTLSCSQTTAGNGSLVFYTTSAATCAGLPSTPPLTGAGVLQDGWTAQTNNATITISTNAALYVGARSLLGSATDQAQIDACTVYWTEGQNAQPVWGVYDSIKNSIYWTATTSASATSNRVSKYDMNLGYFYPFDLEATALLYHNNSVYFGSSDGGYWNRYGQSGIDSDNGTDINAYWKSKDFGSEEPFLEKDFQRISLVARNQGVGTLTVTPLTSGGTGTAYNVSLSTTSTTPYVRSNYNLPALSPQNFMSIRLGNNSGKTFEVLGFRLDFYKHPWRKAP